MAYCRTVQFLELDGSWLPSDYILEAQLDDLIAKLKKRQAALDAALAKAAVLRKEITVLTARIKSGGYRPSQRLA